MARASSPLGWFRGAAFVAAVAGILSLTGCGRSVGSINGTVTYNGAPLKGGNISFVSTEGEPSAAATIGEDGTYKIDRITSGDYKVVVETLSLKPTPITLPPGQVVGKTPVQKLDPGTQVPAGYRPSNPADASIVAAQAFKNKHYVEIPGQYGDSGTTPLTYKAVGGSQTHNVELK